MTYYVTFKIDARFIAEVEAGSLEEALEEARLRYCDADFGEAQDIDGEAVFAEDEHGNYVYEK